MMDKQLIKQYYQENYEKIFSSITFPQWRQWKFIDINGKWFTNDKRIGKPNDLRKFLNQSIPSKVYASVSCFMNGSYGKQTKGPCYKDADNLFMFSDMLFDIDDDSLEIARIKAIQVIDIMKTELNYQLESIHFSGKKGFRIIYTMKERINEHSIEKRRVMYQEEKERVAKKVNIFDDNHIRIATDLYRISCAPYSIKADTGFLVYPIPEEQLRLKPTEEIIVPNIYLGQCPVRSKQPMMKKSQQSYLDKEVSGLPSYPIKYTFVDNMVHGLKNNYIPILKYIKYNYNKEWIEQLQEQYRLGTLLILESNKLIFVVGLKTMQKDRLIKLMRVSQCSNLKEFEYRNYAWLPLTEKIDTDGKIMEQRPRVIDIIEADAEGAYSRPHASLFGLEFDNMSGDIRQITERRQTASVEKR